ncbi:uncharacterized protein LOC119685648 isoform X2 [Teleopsis dalmanni]|uniref:uncharacterized protein LOC119685648 isoform X2 n=1 Tax=Teleopsis dalmanni TaxID=139649 RepID=UPI0018CC7C67|nr:uncharacterized protein LOC119685648 isoform X2 [Teleopsis dalmanni]
MVNDPKMDRNKKTHAQTNQGQSDEDRVEEIEIITRHGIYNKVYEMAEKFASTYVGQFAIDRGDRLLKTVEETAKWSLPHNKSDAKLERPLSWFPFLSLIITLRLTRMWLSIAALMIGNSPVTPQNMVYFIQTRRRKLRAIRMHGIKAIRKREMEANAMKSGQGRRGIMFKLRNLLSSAICRPGQHNERARRIYVQYGRKNSVEDSKPETQQAVKRPREECNEQNEEKPELNLTCSELLDKYANENSDDDSDFIPNPNEDADDSTSSSAEGTSGETEVESNADQHTNGNSKNIETEKNEGDNLNIEFLQNGAKEHDMPKPIIDIKSEPHSEGDQVITQKEANGPSNGEEKQDVDVVKKVNIAINNNKILQLSSNSKHHQREPESADVAHTVNITALMGSPADFKTTFQPVSILKNSNAAQGNQNMAHSTPQSSEENENNFHSVKPTKLPQHSSTQRPHQNNTFQQRYRGKNRR